MTKTLIMVTLLLAAMALMTAEGKRKGSGRGQLKKRLMRVMSQVNNLELEILGLGCQPSPWDPPSTSQTLEAQVNAYQQRVDDLQTERDACLARTTQMPPTTGTLPC